LRYTHFMHPEHRRDLIHDFIDRFVIAHRRGPTLDEICAGLYFSMAIVRADLRVLRERGYVTWTAHKPYTLRTTAPPGPPP